MMTWFCKPLFQNHNKSDTRMTQPAYTHLYDENYVDDVMIWIWILKLNWIYENVFCIAVPLWGEPADDFSSQRDGNGKPRLCFLYVPWYVNGYRMDCVIIRPHRVPQSFWRNSYGIITLRVCRDCIATDHASLHIWFMHKSLLVLYTIVLHFPLSFSSCQYALGKQKISISKF